MRSAFLRLLAILSSLALAVQPAAAQFDFGARGQAAQAAQAAVAAAATASVAIAQPTNGNSAFAIQNRTPQALAAFMACLVKMKAPGSVQHCPVIFLTDSKGTGTGNGTGLDAAGVKNVGAAARNITAAMAQAFAERGYSVQRQSWFGNAGYATPTSLYNYDPRRSQFSTNWVFNGPFSLGGSLLYINSPNVDPVQVTPDSTSFINSFTVFANSGTCGQSGTSGACFSQFSVTDQTTPTTFDGAQSTAAVRKFTATFATRATGKTITIARVNNNGGQFMPVGMMASDTTVPAIDSSTPATTALRAEIYRAPRPIPRAM